jgi:hypothetical protein
MRRIWHGRAAAVIFAAAVLSGCTQYEHYRNKTLAYVGTSEKKIQPVVIQCFSGRNRETFPACEDKEGAAAGANALQHRHYEYTDHKDPKNLVRRIADYHMAFVEFDDQGWFADRKQMEALFMRLRDLELEEKAKNQPENEGDILIMLYAHGWKHNAHQCDNNVICFSRLIERMDILERNNIQGKPARRVVGVYVGWRGLSVMGDLLSNITFWTRKGTADRVGRGGVTELLTRLNDYRRMRNPGRDQKKTQLVIVAHSFGGAVIYSALSHALMERAVYTASSAEPEPGSSGPPKDKKDSGPTRGFYQTAASVGDFVVLVNPAFEGTQYEPLFHIATNRCYPAHQRPVMMTVTSAGDRATGTAFPLGRKVSTFLERARDTEQSDSIHRTVGHAARYETHRLKWTRAEGPTAEEREPARDERDCGCPYLEATTEFNWRAFAAPLQNYLVPLKEKQVPPPVVAEKAEGTRNYGFYARDILLAGDMKYSANYPYLVVKTDAQIIADHNSIYSEPFIRFLHSFFLVHIANGRPFEAGPCWKPPEVEACLLDGLVPCEQSCRFPDGKSCSGRSTDGILTPP